MRECIFYNVEWVEVRKISEAFRVQPFCKMRALRRSAKNLKSADKFLILGF